MISVIVTVYNKEPYIKKCIESIENNTYKDIELIIVEDCSTDNSLEIIEELIQRYDNITLIRNKVNSGAGYSRNVGIKAAKGEWLSLIDADDWIDEDYFQTYLDMVEDDVDIIFGECNVIYSNSNNNQIAYKRNNSIYTDINYVIDNICELKFQFLNISLIKKKLFNNINYCTSRFIEDTPTSYILVYNSKKIQTINYCGYNYYQEPNSLIHRNKEILRDLYFYYNMIWVIEYFNKNDKIIKYKIFDYINQKVKKIFIMYSYDYEDIKPIFNNIDTIMSYFNITKKYMKEQKELSCKLSTAKIIKLK